MHKRFFTHDQFKVLIELTRYMVQIMNIKRFVIFTIVSLFTVIIANAQQACIQRSLKDDWMTLSESTQINIIRMPQGQVIDIN